MSPRVQKSDLSRRTFFRALERSDESSALELEFMPVAELCVVKKTPVHLTIATTEATVGEPAPHDSQGWG